MKAAMYSINFRLRIAHLPSLAMVATTDEMESLEWTKGGQYLDPQENWVAILTTFGFSTKS